MREYQKWKLDKIITIGFKTESIVAGTLWKRIQKRETNDQSIVKLPPFNEQKWLTKLNDTIQGMITKTLSIIRLHCLDPTITSLEKSTLRT